MEIKQKGGSLWNGTLAPASGVHIRLLDGMGIGEIHQSFREGAKKEGPGRDRSLSKGGFEKREAFRLEIYHCRTDRISAF